MTMKDKLLTFCSATALNTGGAGNYTIGDVIPLTAVRDIAKGQPLYLVISVATTATSGGSATAVFSLLTATDSAISSGVTALDYAPSHTVAQMTAGTLIHKQAIPINSLYSYSGYLAIRQTTGTAAFTAGAVNAYLTTNPDATAVYANAI